MRCHSKISQSAWRLLLSIVIISKISDASRCPDVQVEHVILETYELRCCYPLMVDIDNEFEMCSVSGSRDTQRPCGPGLIQPDKTSSEHEPKCISEMEFLHCNSYDTTIVHDGAGKKCICNLDAGFCGLDPYQCKEIRSINCAGYKVDQSCICILPNSLQPITQDRTEVMKTTNQFVNIALSQLPAEENPWTDGKTTEQPYSRGEHDVNSTVNSDVSSNSNNNLSIVLPSVLVPCLLGLFGLLLFCICMYRRSSIRCSAEYSQLRKVKRIDIEPRIRDEEITTQGLKRQDSKVPVQSSSTSSIDNTYEELKTFRREAATKDLQTAVVLPIMQPRERSTTPASPASDMSARDQDPANPASVHFVEELQLPRPVFYSIIPYAPLSTGSLEITGVDRSGEIIRTTQLSESSVTEQAEATSELSQSREVSLMQETREVAPAGAATARRASDFGHGTNVKEYGTNSGQIQELTKGKATTFDDGVAEVRAELPVNITCLEGSTKMYSEDTKLKADKEETVVKCSERTGVLMDGTDMPFSNELMHYGLRNELESESLVRTDGTSNTSILGPSNVASDPSGAQPEETDGKNEETNSQLQNPFPLNSYQALGVPDLPSFMSADSLVNTDSNKDENYE